MSHHPVTIPPGQPIPEPGVEPDGVDSATLMVWGFVSVAIILGTMFGSAALYFAAQNRLNTTRLIAPRYIESEKTLTDQRGVLASYAAPTAEGNPYTIPINRAKQLVLAELQSKKAE
ncbi:hypothetical protein [Botrimarina mediterranea]|uniref:Uncharacterized protein n=1 Tax=Botrimarina mediterranea TaxID=2528022 RepID=A0A518KEU7_9BACT|nr:hypothetical protein [Botrimarina mediterranea]QDV76302.1 hypothetical protein Spa11_45320 [Botrimarina mediterranea]QDV80900.1 hypothetical protein K2D_45350 [Planctomycetes bacterium K2D]